MTATAEVLTTGVRLRRAALHPVTVAALVLAGAVAGTTYAAGSGTAAAMIAFGCAGLLAGYANSGST